MTNERAITNSNGGGRNLKAWLQSETFQQQVKMSLPKHLKPERFIRVAITALTRTPKLAECTQESVFRCLLDLSAMGLEADGRRAHLIPYGKECTLIVDYKGLVELVKRSGFVDTIHADVVCENDKFEYNIGEIVQHQIDFRNPRGKAYAVYATCKMRDGGTQTEVMTVDEIERIRNRSKAGKSGPWVTDWNEMAKKTVFRRLSKWLPLSPEFRDAVEKDDDALEVNARPVGDAPTSLDELTVTLMDGEESASDVEPSGDLAEEPQD